MEETNHSAEKGAAVKVQEMSSNNDVSKEECGAATSTDTTSLAAILRQCYRQGFAGLKGKQDAGFLEGKKILKVLKQKSPALSSVCLL